MSADVIGATGDRPLRVFVFTLGDDYDRLTYADEVTTWDGVPVPAGRPLCFGADGLLEVQLASGEWAEAKFATTTTTTTEETR